MTRYDVTRRRPDLGFREALPKRIVDVRVQTESIAAPLTPEDQRVQSMPDVSLTKWHLAHVTRLFKTFVRKPNAAGSEEFHPDYN